MLDVSVVIPTHARDDLLRDAIRSAVSQTHPPLEVLVCDDLGSPPTRALVEDWSARTEGRVGYVDSSGRGTTTAGASRNVGAAQARGTHLAFLDDDDVWDATHLERLLGVLKTRGVDFVVSWTRADDPTFHFARIDEGLTVRDVVSRNPGFVGSNFLITAAAFRSVGGFDPALRVSNDQDLLVRLLDTGHTYAVLPDFTVLNRIHTAGQLTDKTEKRVRGVKAYYAKHRHLMRWHDRVVIGTIIVGIRRISSPNAIERLWYTGLTAVGRLTLALTRWAA